MLIQGGALGRLTGREIHLFVLFALIFSSQAVLAQNASRGWLRVDATGLDAVYFMLNGDISTAVALQIGDSVSVPAGAHIITFFQKYHVDTEQRVVIQAQQTTRISLALQPFNPTSRAKEKHQSSYPAYVWKGSHLILTDQDARISYERRTQRQYLALRELRTTQATVTHPDFGNKTIALLSSSQPFTVHEFYFRPDASRAKSFSFIPGLSQWYKDQSVKSGVILAALALNAGLWVDRHGMYSSELTKFKNARASYQSAQTVEDALFWGAETERLNLRQLDARKERDVFIWLITAVYVTNVVDGWFSTPASGYRNAYTFDPYIDFSSASSAQAGLTISRRF